ncbi:hypothetical protein [Lewinella sp. IMCC34183]|uniref:hypothetical protein n=1 Tax=Lewinella sp. IMCC34183 TaxID=2248762 RepID=UPI000E220078|nr:hypothetical protein [Lewinella sp. IMCC34183]
MTFSYIGLVIEILLLAVGVYLYLFARGFLFFGGPDARSRAEEFRRDNAGWMRILGLLLAALMLVNVVLHVGDLMR